MLVPQDSFVWFCGFCSICFRYIELTLLYIRSTKRNGNEAHGIYNAHAAFANAPTNEQNCSAYTWTYPTTLYSNRLHMTVAKINHSG